MTLLSQAISIARRFRRPCGLHRGSVLFILLATLAVSSPVIAEESELVIGVFPRRSPSEMMEMFSPLANYLSRQLGRPVKLETAPDFRSFWEAVASGRYQLVHYNQYHYVRSHKEFGYLVIAKNEEAHKPTMAGAILIRKDSEIKTLKDLRGKRIIFGGDRSALMSYIIPTYILHQAGLKKGDYQEEFALNPPNVALAVFFHRADAGGTGDIVFEMPFVRDKIDVSKMKYLVLSQRVAQLPWAVRADMPVSERERIQKALLGIKAAEDGDKILKAAALTNLVPALDDEYNYVRQVIHTVTGERY